MEFRNFLKSLNGRWPILIAVPVVTAIAALLISIKLPNKYISHARLASSVADKSEELVNDNVQQESRVNEEFDNLLHTLTLNKVMDRVSYKLILHDLQTGIPFRDPGKNITNLNPSEKNKAIAAFTEFYNERRPLNLLNSDEMNLYKMLKSSKYDYASLKKDISAFRMDNSQYLSLEYASENPQLSSYVLNTLADEFIEYYTSVSNANRNKSVAYLDSLMRDKQNTLAAQMDTLKRYKIENGILNIDDQAKTIYGEMADMETKKGTAEKDMVAYNSALKNIDSRFSPENRKYLESSVSSVNSDILNTKDDIKVTNDAYIQSGYNEKYKAKIDSLRKKLTHEIYDQSDNYAYNPSATKENLVTQKLNLEVSRDLAQNSVHSLDNELGKLNQNLQKLVPNLATIQAYQAKIDVTNKEYLDILKKYNQASLEANYNVPIRLVEKAVPGDAVPNKKLILVAFSTLASFMLCLFLFFVMFYFDNSIHSSDQLENVFDINVLGSLGHLGGGFLNLQEIWNPKTIDESSQAFKNSLRSIRYEVENNMQGESKIIAITSLYESEGKTFFTESLAYAFSKMNKKVLIIDGNFTHPDISNTFNGPNFIENFLLENCETKMVDTDLISIIGNRGGDGSLLELNNSKNIKEFFSVLKTIYDFIIVETSALESLNKANAKEWISFTDKVVVVFEAGRKLDDTAAHHIKYLRQLGAKLSGMILNKVVSPPPTINFKLLLEKPRSGRAAYN